MFILILVLSFAFFGLGIWAMCEDYEGINVCSMLIGLAMFFAGLIGIFVNTYTIVNGRVIDQKIEMYQEENTAIESDIDILVQNYMEHEKGIMFAAGEGSPITLVNLYPDLKSDELVQEQIRIYTENNDKIRTMKEQKINIRNAKWWLYFGGGK